MVPKIHARGLDENIAADAGGIAAADENCEHFAGAREDERPPAARAAGEVTRRTSPERRGARRVRSRYGYFGLRLEEEGAVEVDRRGASWHRRVAVGAVVVEATRSFEVFVGR